MGGLPFFFYGTLLDARVRRAVIGPTVERIDASAAILRGWRRVRLQGRLYPVIVPAPGCSVYGCLFGPLPASAVAKLVRFEGNEYRRTVVRVVGSDGAEEAAHTFVGSGTVRATAIDWRFDEWERRGRSGFLRTINSGGGRDA